MNSLLKPQWCLLVDTCITYSGLVCLFCEVREQHTIQGSQLMNESPSRLQESTKNVHRKIFILEVIRNKSNYNFFRDSNKLVNIGWGRGGGWLEYSTGS